MSGLFGGGNQTIVNEDKKLAGFQVNSATYGLPVPIVFGTTRVSGNIIDYFDFTAIAHETRTDSGGGGGKGGGGGVTTVNVSYTYQVGLIIGLCEGPISTVGKVWKDKEQFSSLAGLGMTLFTGALGQSPWSYVQSVHPERALPYSGIAYAAGVLDLGGSDSLPQMNYEIKGLLLATGDGIDVNPADVCEYVLSNTLNGVRFSLSNIDTDSLERFWNYCYAADLLISVPLSEQKKTAELLKGICEATKTIHFWSQDKVKFVPRCDERLERSGIIYEPVTTPEYDLTADDFLEQADGRLVIFDRVDPAEAYNHVPIEFINRANEYQPELADGRIEVDINRRGIRSAPVKKIPFLHTKDRAEYVAELEVMGYLYSRNKYTFRLGWMHCLLEPGDFVTLTEATIGLDEQPAIMDSIEEDADGALTCVAYGRQPGIYNPARYGTQAADRPSVDYNADPGNPINPVIFELPAALSGGVMKTYIAAAGGENWGGAHVWISSDGDTYKRIGTITNPARYGELRETLPTGSAVDTVNTLKIDLSDSKAVLNSATQDDADNKRTLCWVDGELIAYQTATLTGTDEYDLTYLVRGCYGTPITEHAAGSRFVRVDENVLFGYQYTVEDLGKQVYFKLQSYNIYASAVQDLEAVSAQTYLIVNLKPPDVTTLFVEHLANNRKRFTWTYSYPTPNDVAGFRVKIKPLTRSSWESSQNLFDGIVAASPYETDAALPGQYTVQVKAVDTNGNESANAATVQIGLGDELVQNVIISHDLAAAGFIGTKTNCSVVGGALVADDSGGAFWPPDNYPFWPADDEPFWDSQFEAMVYEEYVGTDVGQFLLQLTAQGNARATYAKSPSFWPADDEPFWPADDELFWPEPAAADYQPYMSKIITTQTGYYLRVEIDGGPVQGKITRLTAIIDVPDESETINDLAISAGGTRLPLTKSYLSILNVNVSLQDDGGEAVYAKVLDKDAVLGPLIKLFNSSNVATTGVIDATPQGIKKM